MMDRIEAAKVIESVGSSLGLQLYVVTSKAKSLEDVKRTLPQHRDYLRQLEEEGVLFGAGPLWTTDGQYFEGDGLLIYRGSSVEAVEQRVMQDPMHKTGAREYSILPWLLNDGSLTVRISLSEHRRDLT
jgi:uncharacterized protein